MPNSDAKGMAKEFILELLRMATLAVLPVLIPALESGNVDYKVVATLVVVAVLKSIDRALHESKVAVDGITRF